MNASTGNVATSRTVAQKLQRSKALVRVDTWIRTQRASRRAKSKYKKAISPSAKKTHDIILTQALQRSVEAETALQLGDFYELEALMQSAYDAGIPEDGDRYLRLMVRLAKVPSVCRLLSDAERGDLRRKQDVMRERLEQQR